MAKTEPKSDISQLLVNIESQVKLVQDKDEALHKATLVYNTANSELSIAKNELENMRTALHDLLGGALNEAGRVRQTR